MMRFKIELLEVGLMPALPPKERPASRIETAPCFGNRPWFHEVCRIRKRRLLPSLVASFRRRLRAPPFFLRTERHGSVSGLDPRGGRLPHCLQHPVARAPSPAPLPSP